MTLHLTAASSGGNDDRIERGEAVNRPHRHTGGMVTTLVAWLRDFLGHTGSGGRGRV